MLMHLIKAQDCTESSPQNDASHHPLKASTVSNPVWSANPFKALAACQPSQVKLYYVSSVPHGSPLYIG